MPGRSQSWKWFWSPVPLIVFGVLLVEMLGPVNFRQMNAYWSLNFALGYTLAGLWVSRFILTCGIALAALTVIGYQHAGS